ncbi:PREDICTED: probable low affinity copper uptake protein 2 isoform X2 [Myotis brandtii]|uniref:probable low affinity copper uptake protein 2 isoform X1 n=1 Tax=Myotis brandtii TaxID=109478 RepID=UPI0003BBF034|nr:PREDICTED: probable low affinity copper uptake protein 2 isoform X1 [Myotis brandtii]XP_005867909.1 PREDICTED: probable low affinity copper uptake protein 2 isoform X2 [Myotis brandtii]XP_014396446.1 PREDICTED: probable low affinity copper uptake protein 2 isoform X2 [Myotis brandtii]
MHFFFSDKVVLLFDFWNVHSPAGMALSVLVILLLAVLYESIKFGKAKLLHQSLVSMPTSTSQQREETDQGSSSSSESPPVSRPCLRWFLCHFGQSLIHIVQVVIGYFIMLAVMSYNTWIFLGVVLGSAVGYYLAYPLLSID